MRHADGQCTLSYGYAYQGGAFVLDGKTEIMFDEQGRMTKSESFTNVGGEYTLTSYTEYSDFIAVILVKVILVIFDFGNAVIAHYI